MSVRFCRTLAGWGVATVLGLCGAHLQAVPVLAAQEVALPQSQAQGDSLTLRFVEVELSVALQALGRYLNKPLLTAGIPQERVTIDFAAPVPRTQLPGIIRGLVEPRGLEFKEDSAFYSVGPRPVPGAAAGAPGGRPDTAGLRDLALFVIRLKHARAPDVAATINLLFGGSGEFSTQGGLSAGTLSQELRRNVVAPGNAGDKPPAAATGTVRPASLMGPVTLVPDERTNSLLVRAAQADFDVLRSAVADLDIRPLQVLIEVLVVEARKDRSFSLGASFSVNHERGGDTETAQLTGPGSGDLVMQVLHLGRTEVSATLAAAQARGDVNIVSRPVLLASNNAEASLLVGSQRPFVQVSRSLPTDVPTRDQVIQYKDVGTKLTLRPTINEDGYVSLLVQQEISAATAESQFDAPIISTREVRTELLVRDSQTIVLGGLTDQTKERSRSGIPVLSGIPLLGGLFGSTDRRSSSTELFLFLTPRIIRTDADADSLTTRRLPSSERP
ncbi:MAG TPA: secretin N-terminal domain-containing protein [Gemmatimonadales bacterium]|nr:secretin N-terminal domain-containing protein [Gemmatimonadales bacterium]